MLKNIYQKYLSVLREELIPAMGCTEPIAVALAAAKAKEVLGSFPQEIAVNCSGDIIKNVKGVIVPGTGNMRGIEASAILGALAGKPDNQLEVLSGISEEDIINTHVLLGENICTVGIIRNTGCLHIIVTMKKDCDTSLVEIFGAHNNIIRIEKNNEIIYDSGLKPEKNTEFFDRDFVSIEGIYEFANSVQIDDISQLIDMQIEYNTHIAEEGISGNYGANVGSTILRRGENNVYIRAKAFAAAASDARMSGCILPVIINSGSGNQGVAVSLPLIKYAEHLGSDKEKLYRALVISNLTAIHQKTGIGRLSAYCGAVSAGAGCAAGIVYLRDGNLQVINQAIINTLGNISGMVCDGAKPSCAAKIATSVDAALMAADMALQGKGFSGGEGIVKPSAEETVKAIGRLAKCGMRETDIEILNIMLETP